jgi:NADP-dependent 3-hydroxy acid dehydrogenase YdfG
VHSDFSLVRFKGDEARADAVYDDVAMGGPMRPEDVADCIVFALTRPPNVNVDEILVTALAQTTGANILRDSS